MQSLVTLIATTSTNVLAVGGSAIDSVSISPTGGTALVEIKFNCPNRLLDYFLQEQTDSLQISLLRTEQCGSLQLRSDSEVVELPDNSALAALSSIMYESLSVDEAVLRIRFYHSVGATFSHSSDQRLLSITVQTNDARGPVSESGAALGDKPMSEAQVVSLMEEGEAAILGENYSRAIQIYSRALRATENSYTPQALELLGLSRERNDQLAHAVAEYRRYLEHYPNHEGADRVRQRLAGLVTAHKTPQPGPAGGPVVQAPSSWEVYGGISQYYRYDSFKLEGRESVNLQSSILTNADLVLRRRGSRIDLSGRASLGNLWDLLSGDKGPGNQTRFYRAYVEVADPFTGLSGRAGRQTLRTSGVLGRFDGLHVAWEFKPGMRFNLMGGYPVDTTSDGIQTNRHFYGAAMDFEQVADLVDISFFYNRQKIDGLQNREAIGTELRYFDDSKSVVALLDYDIGFKKLNNLVLRGNWTIMRGLTLSASVDHRTSPFLTTRNALIGQPETTIEELSLIYSDDEIMHLAESRSGKVMSYRLGASQSLTDRFQLNADVTMTEFNASSASELLPGIPDQARQYYYSLNLVGSSLFMDEDTSIFGLRHIEGGTTATSTLSIDSRFPVTRNFRINPRLRISYRDNQMGGADSWILFPSLRLIYRIGRRYRLDFEAGGQWIDRNSTDGAGDRSSWFLYGGYRADF